MDPGDSKMDPSSIPIDSKSLEKHARKQSLGTQPAVTTKPASHQSQNRGRWLGAKPLRFAAPAKGEQGVMQIMSFSFQVLQNIKEA